MAKIDIYRPNFDNHMLFNREFNNFESDEKIDEDFYPLDVSKVPKKLMDFYTNA
jgi:hypothetical protein